MTNSFKTDRPFYVAGGTLKPDSPSYIERAADVELFDHVVAGDFCFVLTPRQMGKSSLMARTSRRLRQKGIKSVIIDLTLIGTQSNSVSADKWYFGIADTIVKGLNIPMDLSEWWHKRDQLPSLQRLSDLFSDVLLEKVDDQVVIFVDEIDTTISLAFTDDFFAAIRACYNARATKPHYERLTFVLLGVASPTDLINDPKRTPFNVGHRIELTDFSDEEALPLAAGFSRGQDHNRQILERILFHTNGHPYLTQRLSQLVAESAAKLVTAEDIDKLVEQHFLYPKSYDRETNLRSVRDRLIGDPQYLRPKLKEYLKVLEGKLVTDKPLSRVHNALKLSGLVKVDEGGYLRVRNRIYGKVFDKTWLGQAMPADRKLRVAVTVSIAILVFGFSLWYTIWLPNIYINLLQKSFDIESANDLYSKLRKIPGYSNKADRLLAEFWERCAVRAEFRESRDTAILCRLKSIEAEDTQQRRKKTNNLISYDYVRLKKTLRHESPVESVRFGPDGATIATASSDGTAQLWDTAYGNLITEPVKPTGKVTTAEFSPDGKLLAFAIGDGEAQLWNVITRKRVNTILHKQTITAVAFSPDGTHLATASADKTAQIWDVTSPTGPGELLNSVGEIMHHEDPVAIVKFSPNGKLLATATVDGTLQVWDAETGARIFNPMSHLGQVAAIEFSPNDALIAVVTGYGAAHIWDFAKGENIFEPLRIRGAFRAIAFSYDGALFATASDDLTARLWNVHNGKPIGKPMRHEGNVTAVRFSPDGKILATGSDDNTVRLWDASRTQPIGEPMRHEAPVTSVCFSPDGALLASASKDKTTRIWDTSGAISIKKPNPIDGKVDKVKFSPDGKFLATTSSDYKARIWNAETGVLFSEIIRENDEYYIYDIAISPIGKLVATPSGHKEAQLWNAEIGAFIGEPMQHEGFVRFIEFCPTGALLATASNNTVQFWDGQNGKIIGDPMQHEGVVSALAFSSDGSRLATASADHPSARLWNTTDGSLKGKPMYHEESVNTIRFSHNGELLVTASHDNTARIWDATDGTLKGEPMRHDGYVTIVKFSPDDAIIATVSADKIVRIWDAQNGSSIGEPLRHRSPVKDVMFNLEGDQIIAITKWWIHVSQIIPEPFNLKPMMSLLLERAFSEASYIPKDGKNQMLVVIGVNEGPIKATTIQFDSVDTEPLMGEPNKLIETWENLLALKLDKNGSILP